MSSLSFGVRPLITALGLPIKLYRAWVKRYMRSMCPYYALVLQDGPIVAQSVLERTPSYPFGLYCDRSRRLVHGPL